MKKPHIDTLLEELSQMIPEVKDDPESFKKFILKFIEARPGSTIDGIFRQELRAEVLQKAQMMKPETPQRKNFLVWPILSFCGGAALTAFAILPMWWDTPQINKNLSEHSVQEDSIPPAPLRSRMMRGEPHMAKQEADNQVQPEPMLMRAEPAMMEAVSESGADMATMEIMPTSEPMALDMVSDEMVRTSRIQEIPLDRPSDSELIFIAHLFLDERNIDGDTYGEPEVQYWGGPVATVQFSDGLRIEIDIQTKKVIRLEMNVINE